MPDEPLRSSVEGEMAADRYMGKTAREWADEAERNAREAARLARESEQLEHDARNYKSQYEGIRSLREKERAGNGNGNGWMSNMPTWAKVVASVGLPVALCIGWFAQDAGLIPSRTGILIEQLGKHDQRMSEAIELRIQSDNRLSETLKNVAIEMRRANNVSAALCFGMFKDSDIRAKCLER